jgi:hypothetical protein
MFKIIKNVIYVLIIAVIVFIVLSLWKGGEPFRWFGEKSEKAGEVIKDKSEKIGEEADKLKEKTGDIKNVTKKVTEGIKEQGEKVKEIAGSKNKNGKNSD